MWRTAKFMSEKSLVQKWSERSIKYNQHWEKLQFIYFMFAQMTCTQKKNKYQTYCQQYVQFNHQTKNKFLMSHYRWSQIETTK